MVTILTPKRNYFSRNGREGIKFNKKMYFFVGDWKNLTIIYLLVALDAQSTEICGRDSVPGEEELIYIICRHVFMIY